jgi:surface antigen
MTSAHWPAVAGLAIALAGCHAIYGRHDTPAAAPPPAAATSPGATPTNEAARETASGGSGATVGTVGGDMAAQTLAGTLAGGYFGSRLGNGFDEGARRAAASAERQALANDAPADWSDPHSGASGRVRPLRSFTDAAGRACREYSQTVVIAGRRQSDTGIACRRSDGTWSLVGS